MAIDFTPDTSPSNTTIQFTPDETPSSTTPEPTTSKLESFGRGFAQSATLGFGKWINGFLDANNNIPSPDVSKSDLEEMRRTDPEGAANVEQQMYPQQSGPKTGQGFWADVTASVEQQKKDNDNAFSDHPGYYIGGSAAPVVAGGVIKGAGSVLSKVPGLSNIDAGLGIGEGIAAPSGWGIPAAASASGAVQGATDSTTGKQLLTNVPTQAATAGLLSLVPAGVLAGLDKIGVKSAISRLTDLVGDATSKNPITSGAALSKIKSLVSGKPNEEFDINEDSKKELVEHAKGWADILRNPEKNAEFDPTGENSPNLTAKQSRIDATGHVVSQIAPSLGTVAGDLVLAAPGAGAMAYGAHLGGIPGAITGAGGALLELPTGIKLAKDAGNYLGMKYAGSQGGQDFLGTGTISGSTGLSGILGTYLENNWLNK